MHATRDKYISILLQTLCGNQLCHFLLLLIFFVTICHYSFYKLTHLVLQVKIDNMCKNIFSMFIVWK